MIDNIYHDKRPEAGQLDSYRYIICVKVLYRAFVKANYLLDLVMLVNIQWASQLEGDSVGPVEGKFKIFLLVLSNL